MSEIKDVQANIWKDLGGQWADKYWNYPQKRGKQFVNYFEKSDIKSIFEVGCNSGRNLYYINKNLSLDKIGGLEISPHAAQEARNNVPDAIIYEGNLHNLDVDEKFDVVFTGGVLMHIPPENVKDVIRSLIKKANSYIVHMEPVGKDIVTHGPKELVPRKQRQCVRCLHDIPRIYDELGMSSNLDIRHAKDPEPFIVCKL